MNLNTLIITPELLRIISEIDEFNGGWKAQSGFNPDYLTQLRHVATIESIGSSTRIEGSTLTDSEIESLLGQVGKQSFANRDEQEVIGYAEVMETIIDNFEHISITENYIKQLHISLLRHSSRDERYRGEYKNIPIVLKPLMKQVKAWVWFLKHLLLLIHPNRCRIWFIG